MIGLAANFVGLFPGLGNDRGGLEPHLVQVLVGLVGDVVATVFIPAYLAPLVDLTGGTLVGFPSEMVPSLGNGVTWLQRLGAVEEVSGLWALALEGKEKVVGPKGETIPHLRRVNVLEAV